MKILKKQQQSSASRRRLQSVVLLMFGCFAATIRVVVKAQETVTAEEADTDVTGTAASSSSPDDLPLIEDYIDLDDTGLVEEKSDDTTTIQQSAKGDTTETSVSAPKIEPEDKEQQEEAVQTDIVQKGPLVDLLGPTLLSLVLTGENTARFEQNLTNDALSGKTVVGLYFSADWCGPCRQFTPELVRFYEKMNGKRGKKDQFQIVWISRCRDVNAYTQYFAQMPWIALPPEEAMGARGQMLGEKFGVKGIPSLVLLDDLGSVITKDARNMVPKDMNGIGFPWRNPLATLYMTIIPRSLRLMIKTHFDTLITQVFQRIKNLVTVRRPKTRTA